VTTNPQQLLEMEKARKAIESQVSAENEAAAAVTEPASPVPMEAEETEIMGEVELEQKALEEQNMAASSAALDLLAAEAGGQAEADKIRDSLMS
jgi:hypothetical protein